MHTVVLVTDVDTLAVEEETLKPRDNIMAVVVVTVVQAYHQVL